MTLAAIIAPNGVKLVEKAKIIRAKADTEALAVALIMFYINLKRFPACGSDPCGKSPLGYLSAGSGKHDINAELPQDPKGLWNFSAKTSPEPQTNNIYNHLVRNSPTPKARYNPAKWAGPYIQGLKNDPWGHAYIINAEAMSATAHSGGQGWILSAGPDGELETTPSSVELAGDDIGFILISQKTAED